jgi:hypothetical protein
MQFFAYMIFLRHLNDASLEKLKEERAGDDIMVKTHVTVRF